MSDAATRPHANAVRVQEALRAAGSPARIRTLSDSARTVSDAARTRGVEEGQIAKSLVFLADGEPVLVVASGRHRVDPHKLRAALGASSVDRADADTVRAATGFPIGGVSPVGHRADLRTVVDTALGDYDVVWAAAGTPHAVFPTTYDELLALTRGTPAEVGG